MDTFMDVMKSWGPAIIGGIFLVLVIALGAAATNALTELDKDKNNAELKMKYNSLATAAAVFGILMVAAFGVQGFLIFRRYKNKGNNVYDGGLDMFNTPDLSMLSSTF